MINAFQPKDSFDIYQDLNGAILEAVGKCGSAEHLKQISTTTTYTAKDTHLVEGQARGIYRFGKRGISHPEATKRVVARFSPAPWLFSKYTFLGCTLSVSYSKTQPCRICRYTYFSF